MFQERAIVRPLCELNDAETIVNHGFKYTDGLWNYNVTLEEIKKMT